MKTRTKMIGLVLLTASVFVVDPVMSGTAIAASSYDSDRDQVRSRIASGGWHVVWGELINEAEYGKFVAACYAGNPMGYFTDYLNRSIAKFERTAPDVGRQALRQAVIRALKDRGRTFNVGKIGVKGGIATYRRWKFVSAHVPDGTERYKIRGPFGTWTWGWRPKMKLVKKRIPLPNHHQPYVAFRLYGTSGGNGGGGGGPSVQSKVWIYNQTRNPIFFQISRGGGRFENQRVDPNRNMWFSTTANPPRFVVKFDWSFAPGFQERRYNLRPNSHNDFRLRGNGIDLTCR